MFRKQDFKKVDLLGSGKKNTKIYKAEHIPTGKYYAIKEVEAKTLDKLNEYKVRSQFNLSLRFLTPYTSFHSCRKKPCSYLKFRATQTCCNSSDTTSMRPCTTLTVSPWCVSIWTVVPISSTCSESERVQVPIGSRMSLRE